MIHRKLKLIEGSEEIIPLIIERFLNHLGKSRAIFELRKASIFFPNHSNLLEGNNDHVAYNIFLETSISQCLSEILLHISKSEVYIDDYLDFLKALYFENGYDLDLHSQIPLKPIESLKTLDTDENVNTWLEKNAPNEVFQKIFEARTKMGNNLRVDALHDCRLAFEKFTTTGNFSDALQELVQAGLIERGLVNAKKDYEAIQLVYHYLSTLGSHTASQRPSPTFSQANFGYEMTEVTLRYLIKILRKGKASSVSLTKWIEIN